MNRRIVLVLASIAAGCASIVGIEEVKKPDDDGSSSSSSSGTSGSTEPGVDASSTSSSSSSSSGELPDCKMVSFLCQDGVCSCRVGGSASRPCTQDSSATSCNTVCACK